MKSRGPEDYFAGAVPAGVIFDMQVYDMRSVARMRPPEGDLRDTPFAELCLIGLVAYFEGFCKNHFASIINICPQLLRELQTRGRDISVSAFHLLDAGDPILPKLGYLVAEGFDFGTAKAINGMYCDLLRVTPFSKDEMARFAEILDDRNLLVHHGGIFGPRYARERFIKRETGLSRLFLDSLVVTTDQLEAAATFLHSISMKVRTATESALSSYVRERRLKLSRGAREAVESLGWADSHSPAD
ncbi:MAG: hypothetical protein QOF62_2090 [Pyrinomonadaceae bacterium]|jgi:hypothetical protein|nr:hypothetical protein [Pyrinomonadaceae bacterium]